MVKYVRSSRVGLQSTTTDSVTVRFREQVDGWIAVNLATLPASGTQLVDRPAILVTSQARTSAYNSRSWSDNRTVTEELARTFRTSVPYTHAQRERRGICRIRTNQISISRESPVLRPVFLRSSIRGLRIVMAFTNEH